MSKQFDKIDDHTIRVTDQIPVTQVYDYDALLSIQKRTQQEKVDAIAKKDKEISDLQEIISAAQGLGIISATSAQDTEPVSDEPINP